MANCCVESTVRAACDLGFNVVTVIDCVATTSQANIWTSLLFQSKINHRK